MSVCVRLLRFQKQSYVEWELSTTSDFKCWHVKSILKVVKRGETISGWPIILVDLSNIIQQIPGLTEMDKEREEREQILRIEEKEKIKQRDAADMTVRLLHEVLHEINVTYNQWKS